MISLQIVGEYPNEFQHVAARLRGGRLCDSSQSCDAIVQMKSVPSDSLPPEHDKHLLLCSPLAVTRESLTAMVSTARQSNAVVMIANPDRYLPSRQMIRARLDAGHLGEVGLVRIHRWNARSELKMTEQNSDQREEGLRTSGLLNDLDLTCWLMGKPPKLVYALVQSQHVQLHLGFDGGAMALLDFFDGLPDGAYQAVSVIGSRGAAYADDHDNMQLLLGSGGPRAVTVQEGNLRWVGMLQEFIDSIQQGRDRSEDVANWCRMLAIEEAASKSVATRTAVPVEYP